MGHSIDVYASPSSTSSELPGLKVVRVASLGGKYTETITRSVASLTHALGRYDVVHLHAIGPGILSAATRLFAQPSIVTIHGLDQRRDKWGPVARTCLSLAERTIVGCADQVAVVSEELRRYFLERHDLRTSFIPNGLPIVTHVSRGPLLDAVGIGDRPYVFFASRLTPEKGCHDLIEAHARLNDGTLLIVAGKATQAEYEVYLTQIAGPNVIFVGHQSGAKLQELYSNASLFVLPSYLEGMSMALLEAIAHRIPIVVSDIPENMRVVGGTAICFSPRDIGGLVNALRLGLARRGRASANPPPLPTWAKIAESYSVLYQRVADRRPVLTRGEFHGTAS
jgi:glycosyltransferase involved in cell wall biosynthesis